MEGVSMRERPILLVLALVAQLIAASAASGQTRPRLAETSLYTKLASGCVEVDMTGWQHPTKAVFEREAKPVRRLQLCNSRVYPVFFTQLLYDPRLAHNDGYVSKLVADVFNANAKHPFSIIDTLDNVIIEVSVRADRTPQFSAEEYEE
jgi:hypothetical protein